MKEKIGDEQMLQKNKLILRTIFIAFLIVGLIGCSNATSTSSVKDENEEVDTFEKMNEEDLFEDEAENKSIHSLRDENSVEDENEKNTSTENKSKVAIEQEKSNEINTNEEVEPVAEEKTKVVGRKTEFLNMLDQIQEELDAMPEKEHVDRGVTNAMKNYYGVGQEKYDKALNEIYALLREELSEETMENLKTIQLQWIEEKERKAEEEREKYAGGTFEYVAFYISLYESTKERCYELVNEYMTD